MNNRRGKAVNVPADKLSAAEALRLLPPSLPLLELDVTQPISVMAALIGAVAKEQPIFRRGCEVVTVNEETGETQLMTPGRFCGWIEQFFSIEHAFRQIRPSLNRETASVILELDKFLLQVRPLQAVHFVRLPVRRLDDSVELLAPGYDEQAQIFTVERLSYPPDWSRDDAIAFLVDLLGEYPWGDFGRNGDLIKNPNFARYVMALVGVFCRALFGPGTKRPAMIFTGNQPGVGKTTLAALPLIAVFGSAPSTKLPSREEEVEKLLATKAATLAPFIFFDNASGSIFSDSLNQFITASSHTGRIMGGNREVYCVPNVCQVFLTGNTLTLTADVYRRAMVMELFLPAEVRGRNFRRRLTDTALAQFEMRSSILAALWALVQNWCEQGHPVHLTPLESFEEWSSVVAGIVRCAGIVDPLIPADVAIGGDEESREIRQLLVALADRVSGTYEFTRREIVDAARELGVLDDLCGSEGGPDINANQNKRLGKRLKEWRGRELTDSIGRKFRFGHRRTNKAKLYPCTIIDDVDVDVSERAEHGDERPGERQDQLPQPSGSEEPLA